MVALISDSSLPLAVDTFLVWREREAMRVSLRTELGALRVGVSLHSSQDHGVDPVSFSGTNTGQKFIQSDPNLYASFGHGHQQVQSDVAQ